MAGTPVVVLGGTGQLGRALLLALSDRGEQVAAPGRDEVDLERTDRIAGRLEAMRPRALINASAFNDVAGAELEANREPAFRINRDAPRMMAETAARLGVPLIHVSTDYVFDGDLRRPYVETDLPRPIQVYGESKLAGEQAVIEEYPAALVVRTSTLYGHGRAQPHYVDAILAQARTKEVLEVVQPPVSSPTLATDLARGLLALLDAGAEGVVHYVNDGACSRLELAREAVKLSGLAGRVEVRERPEPAEAVRRPAYSVLDTGRFTAITGTKPRSWQTALADYIQGSPA